MTLLELYGPSAEQMRSWKVRVQLEGSKSISNRALIALALCPGEGISNAAQLLDNLSPSEDTHTMLRLLQSDEDVLDAGAAGTTFRFLTAFMARSNRAVTLTGSARMLQRPIRILVEALQELGADIAYLGEAGYPPLRIQGRELAGGRIKIPADVSSQYISALLLIGPMLRDGLELELVGKIGSRPYITMTLRMMEQFGAKVRWEGMIVRVQPKPYRSVPFRVEGDWSAASYYYSMMALAPEGAELAIDGLFADSYQGDAVLTRLYEPLGVRTQFTDRGVVLQRHKNRVTSLPFDFSDCPDLAQTVVVTCAALGISGQFVGLESLRIKETDRTAALQTELAPFGVEFVEKGGGLWQLHGHLTAPPTGIPTIKTYDDHRMAMAFAPLAMHLPVLRIQDPEVVRKSYPGFWNDLRKIGFSATEIPA